MEKDVTDLLGRLDERSKHIKDDVHSILEHLKNLNGKVAVHQQEIQKLREWRATSSGHWLAVNKIMGVILTILSIAVVTIATYLWH